MPRPFRLRLLFDEQMSTSVAKALACLNKPVVYVGGEDQLAKGTPDDLVAKSAKRQRRVLLTVNFDMVLAACEEGARFIWFDQRRRSPTMMETAFILLRQWDTWEQKLSDPSAECLKVGRGASRVLSLDQARRRAERRFRESNKSKQDAKKRASDLHQGRLQFDD